MNEHDEKIFTTLATKSPVWTVVAMFVHRLPLIISAALGTAGVTAVVKSFL